MITSEWLPIGTFLTELLTHASKEVATHIIDVRANKHIFEPVPLLQLRAHLDELQQVTGELAVETSKSTLSECYSQLRARWLALFAPAQTVLHNFDPIALSALKVYSPELASLLTRGIFVSEKSLSDALIAERAEIYYDDQAHLCTLCLQIVKEWSGSPTIIGGLDKLSVALKDTLESLDVFIKTNWPSPAQLRRFGTST
jgi:hypothetical protein